jgi:radical SAM/Cys-rich protein
MQGMEWVDSPPIEKGSPAPDQGWGVPFREMLHKKGLALVRDETSTLQMNVGLLCNQTCRHCHLEAGPDRREIMTDRTVDQVVAYAERSGFSVADITGGAPELNPNLTRLIAGLANRVPRIMIRSNLTALSEGGQPSLIEFLKTNGVVVVASLPSLESNQTDGQRGSGVFQRSISALQQLNAVGYGREGSGLELNLVSNPCGAYPPPPQVEAEKRFRRELQEGWGIDFNQLFTLANVPLGRYRGWLDQSGNLQSYLDKLVAGFNPATLKGVMCRTLVSVSWDGFLYDCDFNLALDLPFSGRRIHVSEMDSGPAPGTPVVTADHCYTCTAGSGFT